MLFLQNLFLVLLPSDDLGIAPHIRLPKRYLHSTLLSIGKMFLYNIPESAAQFYVFLGAFQKLIERNEKTTIARGLNGT
jgi:hypothetical protein